MNERHREVHNWLEKTFAGDPIPNYEITAQNIDILFNLMQHNEHTDNAADLVIQDLNKKAEEYQVESERINKTLNQLAISPDTLSQSGISSLKTLSKIAVLLDVKDASETSILLGLTEARNSMLNIQDERQAEQKMCADLFSKSTDALHRYSTLSKALEDIEIETEHEEPELEKKAKQASYLQSKAKEYKKNLQQGQLELEENKVTPSIYHHYLVKTSKELEDLRKELQPLKAKLESYHQLPPDLSLARVKVEEKKMQLKELEAELAKNCMM